MSLIGEVVPPELAPLLLDLAELTGFLVALGLVLLVSQLVTLLIGLLDHTVGQIPKVGGIISGAANWLGSQITNVLGQVAVGLDKRIASYWYVLGDLARWGSDAIGELSYLSFQLADAIGKTRIGGIVFHAIGRVFTLIYTVEHKAVNAYQLARSAITTLEHPERGLLGRALHAALSPFAGRIGAVEKWIAGTGGYIAGEIDTVIEPDIAALRDRATQLENQAIRVYQDAAGAWHAVNVDAIAAAITLALPALGWQWLRCNSLAASTSGRGCGLWNGLEDILGLLVDTALLASACQIIAPLETVISDVAVPVVDALTTVGAGLCQDGIGAPPPLPIPRLYLPPNPSLSVNVG